jgi:hypothetical protein
VGREVADWVEGWEVWLSKMMVSIAWVALRKWQRAGESKRKTLHSQKRNLYDQTLEDDKWSKWVQCTIFMSFLSTICLSFPSVLVQL